MPTPDRTEILENELHKQAAINIMLQSVDVVVGQGVEGVKVVALTHPDLILDTITSLTNVLRLQQEQIRLMLEEQFEIYDIIESASAAIEK